jgi:hypothetical protein
MYLVIRSDWILTRATSSSWQKHVSSAELRRPTLWCWLFICLRVCKQSLSLLGEIRFLIVMAWTCWNKMLLLNCLNFSDWIWLRSFLLVALQQHIGPLALRRHLNGRSILRCFLLARLVYLSVRCNITALGGVGAGLTRHALSVLVWHGSYQALGVLERATTALKLHRRHIICQSMQDVLRGLIEGWLGRVVRPEMILLRVQTAFSQVEIL